jgi:hypothetical protein
MRTVHHDQERQFPHAGQLRGARLVELSKIAHRDAEVLEANPEVAPDNEAHHARTKLRFLRKRHFRFTPKADVEA